MEPQEYGCYCEKDRKEKRVSCIGIVAIILAILLSFVLGVLLGGIDKRNHVRQNFCSGVSSITSSNCISHSASNSFDISNYCINM